MAKDHEPMMTEIFESFEYHIFEKLVSVDSMLAKMAEEASTCGVPASFRIPYIKAKLYDMFDQIAENREAKRA